jgi:hypothetical protein
MTQISPSDCRGELGGPTSLGTRRMQLHAAALIKMREGLMVRTKLRAGPPQHPNGYLAPGIGAAPSMGWLHSSSPWQICPGEGTGYPGLMVSVYK